ncbi:MULTISPECIES: amino acid permease [unclassified Clostridium]|uniref:APC family permease n=1 Tax=unclassified Clostridium TaxID=2614128 RepID=UPI000297DDF3|nr:MULTISPECIES: amino acid permease [unclassified Clostridium]EKQ56706.1 MAG: amino acid transporter [Clostridium sp. Maddingley MBC34-26]
MKQQIELRKSITWVKGSAITIGAVLGSGILALPAIAAEMAGPASILSWLLMSIFSAPMVIAIGMMSSQFPNSGGMAAYARQAFGPFWGRLIGCLILSAMPLGMPITALIGAQYLGSAFSWSSSSIHIAAALLIIVAVILNYMGVELSGRVQVVVISIILIILIFTVGSSMQQIRFTAFYPFASNGWIPVGQAMNLLFFAFMGWEMIGHLSEEFYNPHKDIPLSLCVGFLLINLLYFSVAFVTIGSSIYKTGNPTTAMIDLIAYRWGTNAGGIIAFLGFIICYCTVHTYIAGFSRLVYAEAKEGNFPASFGKLHSRYQSPYVALFSFIPLFIIMLFLSWRFSWELKALVSIPSTTFLMVYIISMVAAAKVLCNKIGKISAYISAFLSSIVFLFAGWFVVYPLMVIIIGFYFKKRKDEICI